MKRLWALLAGCSLAALSHPASAFESRGARPCIGWQEFRQEERAGYTLQASIYQTWLVGYLSGLVAGSGVDFLAGTDNEKLFQMVDAFCSDNRQMNLDNAGIYVAKSLLQQKGIVYLGTRP
ncbi:MAG: hypothetical protein PHY45_10625 [Rhodocyclaceae bacterium]|nr:hypothetical protein [Rhodocyclaceae bacterium]